MLYSYESAQASGRFHAVFDVDGCRTIRLLRPHHQLSFQCIPRRVGSAFRNNQKLIATDWRNPCDHRFAATVGQFVLCAALRIQANPENKETFPTISPDRCVPSTCSVY